MNGYTKHAVTSEQPTIENTRRELLNFLTPQIVVGQATASPAIDLTKAQRKELSEASEGFRWSSLIEAGLASWWRDHPARAGAMLVRSVTEGYTRQKPLQVITVAAITGAAIVLLRPWRLMSSKALALTLFRSSNFTGMATSVLETAANSMQPTRKERP